MLSKHPFHELMHWPYSDRQRGEIYTISLVLASMLRRRRQASPLHPPHRPLPGYQQNARLRPDPRSPRTHALLVEAIEHQSRRSRRLLRASANLIDGVERMAEDSVCTGTCSSALLLYRNKVRVRYGR